jgi:glycosyltransferase involved in cell wall biosynthesis
MMTLNILHIASGQGGWGGTEKHIIDVASALKRRGHRVTIGCQPGSEVERRAQAAGLATIYLTMRKQHDWKQLPHFVRALRNRYDVVHIHDEKDYIVPSVAARFMRVPVLVMTRHKPTHFRNALVAWACSAIFYDKIIAVSDFGRGLMLADRVSPDRIVVVKNGMDAEHFRQGSNSNLREELGIPATAFVVAVAGRLIRGKGFDILIRAVAAARRRGLDAHCLIAGTGDKHDELVQLSQELGVQSAVRLLGFRSDIAAVFGAADAVSVPSSTLPETFCYAALEGLASGRPVIASRFGALPELITPEAGYLTSPGDPESIAEVMIELARDPEMRVAMGKEAVRRSQEFSLDACAGGLEAVYTSLMTKGPTAAPENVPSEIRS